MAKKQVAGTVKEYDITTLLPDRDIQFEEDELVIIGVPVYSGRIPAKAREGLLRFKGSQTPAIIVCTYGNRDYDDALLELKDLSEENNFKVIAAGAFISRHCIFPTVATQRPDAEDMEKVDKFVDQCFALLAGIEKPDRLSSFTVKGNRPYKESPGNAIPLQTNESCTLCGSCIELCPMEAIDETDPKVTDYATCISCGRCIIVCPEGARSFSGDYYKAMSEKFTVAFSARKEPETVLASISATD